jgi:60 kDa SS-A/Ro ribonucleoprotein
MARLNTSSFRPPIFTHEGGPAIPIPPLAQLRRSVMSCLLWEKEFYEDGIAIADRIAQEASAVSLGDLAAVAVEAKSVGKLRHVPLLLAALLDKRVNDEKPPAEEGAALVRQTVRQVILRADEPMEFLTILAKVNGTTPDKIRVKLSRQVRIGLARALEGFDEYQLAKYGRNDSGQPVKLRDVIRLVHPKPTTPLLGALWKSILDGKLAVPDTWETALSSGADKKETFERLLQEDKLGYLALLRNLRNMVQAGVDLDLVREKIKLRKGAARVLPFRYVAAARVVPQLEAALDVALEKAIEDSSALDGKTVILVDVSGSMDYKLSQKSDLTRMDAAATLASVIKGDLRVFTFSNSLVEVPARRGMAGIDAIRNSQPHGGTLLGAALGQINRTVAHDRIVVITDEQSHDDAMMAPAAKKAYMINVASARNGVGYRQWTHIDGFSENVIRFIREVEA